jgi:hypothetical protein
MCEENQDSKGRMKGRKEPKNKVDMDGVTYK